MWHGTMVAAKEVQMAGNQKILENEIHECLVCFLAKEAESSQPCESPIPSVLQYIHNHFVRVKMFHSLVFERKKTGCVLVRVHSVDVTPTLSCFLYNIVELQGYIGDQQATLSSTCFCPLT